MDVTSLHEIELHAFNRALGICECSIKECNHPRRSFLNSCCKNKLAWKSPNEWDVMELDTDNELTMENSILLCHHCFNTRK